MPCVCTESLCHNSPEQSPTTTGNHPHEYKHCLAGTCFYYFAVHAPPNHNPTSLCLSPPPIFIHRKDPEKDADKEEQFRIQQELLARRKTGAWQQEVQERRAEVSKYMKDPEYKRKVDAEKRKRYGGFGNDMCCVECV